MTDTQKSLSFVALLVVASVAFAIWKDNSPYPITATSRGGDPSMMEYALTASAPNANFASKEMVVADSAGETAATTDARVIRNASLSLLVDSIEDAINQSSIIAEKYGGYVQHSNTGESPDGSRYGYTTLRVKDDQFTDALTSLKEGAVRVKDESVTAEDVTEQYTDLKAQLSNKRNEEQAYIGLLNRAGSVNDLLQVQRELSNVRGRIESLQGRIQYLENQTDYSTITVNFEEDRIVTLPSKKFRFIPVVRDAVAGLISVVQWLVTALVWIVIVGIPVCLVVWLGVIAYRKIKRHRIQ